MARTPDPSWNRNVCEHLVFDNQSFPMVIGVLAEAVVEKPKVSRPHRHA